MTKYRLELGGFHPIRKHAKPRRRGVVTFRVFVLPFLLSLDVKPTRETSPSLGTSGVHTYIHTWLGLVALDGCPMLDNYQMCGDDLKHVVNMAEIG